MPSDDKQDLANLSEVLFKPHHHDQETSSLIDYHAGSKEQLASIQANSQSSWYRALRRMQWIWQGLSAIEIEYVLSNIAASDSNPNETHWLDTIAGYRPGNWSYEWTQLGMQHQTKAQQLQQQHEKAHDVADEYYLASLCFSIASYPHLKGDSLSIQAQVLANKAYAMMAEATPYVIKDLDIPYKNKKIKAHLHLPHTERPLPVVIVAAGIDSLQTDMWRLFSQHLAENEIAMLTIDMPGVGHSSHWSLTEDSSNLHQAVLEELPNIPWVDHFSVGLIGFRFGGNALVRLAFLQQEKIKACVALGAPLHQALADPEKLAQMPKMYLDALASRLGKKVVDIPTFSRLLRAWSLKSQGILAGRRTTVPILAVGLDGDPIGSKQDNQLVATFSQGGKALQLSDRSISQGYEQALKSAVEWLKDELNK